ncbi:MAG: sugar transporter [Campylobacteraceae bacterium]|jgi:hypothetical protein|nr:sugar transporter [Campylobacteraceae bacterium]
MKIKKRLLEGDIFYIHVSGKYVFGKLLMDIKKRIFKLEPRHRLKFYSDCYLVEIYKGIYDTPELATREIIYPASFIFHSTFYPSKNFKKYVQWSFYKNESINYKEIDFPETLEIGDNGLINFRKFDISLPTKTLFKDFPKKINGNQKYTGTAFTIYDQLVDEAFHLQGRDDLLQDKEKTYFSSANELRLQTKDRVSFYEQINEDTDISYYKLALKYGFDLGRFYEK